MIDEQIIFIRLDGSANAGWSLLLAVGYLKVQNHRYVGKKESSVYIESYQLGSRNDV